MVWGTEVGKDSVQGRKWGKNRYTGTKEREKRRSFFALEVITGKHRAEIIEEDVMSLFSV